MVVAGDEGAIEGAVASPTNPLTQVHALLRGRYWVAIILAIVGAVAGGIVGYKIQKPMYTSTGAIHFKPSLPRILNDQTPLMPMFDAYMGTQVARVRSRRVIDYAMQQSVWKQLNRGLAPEQVQEFIESLESSNPKGSELVIVSFTDRDPEAARRAGHGCYRRIRATLPRW
jgi:capsular polysaccharide biosynthesis protein